MVIGKNNKNSNFKYGGNGRLILPEKSYIDKLAKGGDENYVCNFLTSDIKEIQKLLNR